MCERTVYIWVTVQFVEKIVLIWVKSFVGLSSSLEIKFTHQLSEEFLDTVENKKYFIFCISGGNSKVGWTNRIFENRWNVD